jgi:putative aldouronate transport system permease protein
MLQANAVAGEAIKYAAIFITILPIMVVYLWVQKYFVQGVLLGSVKG